MNNKIFQVATNESRTTKRKSHNSYLKNKISPLEKNHLVPLIKLAYARSGDKGDHANIGVIARRKDYFDFINRELSPSRLSKFFSHVLKGDVQKWELPGINGLNFLLKNALGGGGMASLNLDPQGKAYAQQLLEYPIPVTKELFDTFKS